MLKHRTQNLSLLLVLLQLILPVASPWLHTVVDGSFCASNAEHPAPTCSCHHHPHESDSDSSSPDEPVDSHHDCSDCAICQAVSAPRTPTVLFELPALAEQTGFVGVAEYSGPVSVFRVPARGRAPPVA